MNDNDRPAFPFEHGHSPDAANVRECGMSLRDYFAAAALAGIITCGSRLKSKHDAGYPGELTGMNMARIAYEIADDMLEARK